MKAKLYISRSIKLVAFALAVILSTYLLQTFLLKRIDNNTMRMEAFYLEEKGTIDAALIGASDVYAGYSAPYAYEKYGYTSYPYATQSSPANIVLPQIKEVIKYQNPKMIVVEINAFLYKDNELPSEASQRMFADNVPHDDIWRDYLAYIEKEYHGKATAVSFRDKEVCGWTAHKESFIINGKKVINDNYTNLFYKHIMLRHSCGACHFTNITRPSDITLADFWGWEKVDTKFNSDDKGVSLVLINSPKGKEIFNAVIEDLNVVETILQVAMKQNHPLNHPSDISPLRDKFEKEYKNKGFEYVFKKYGKFDKPGIFVEFINKIKWNFRKRVFNKLWKKRK